MDIDDINENINEYIISIVFLLLFCNYIQKCILDINNKIKYQIILKGKTLKDENLIRECVICLQNININEKIIKLRCNHYFHKSCVLLWINKNKTCPTCRKDIP